ncbi:hypothetical protein MTO96_010352 [Rhipicephalus appendiculatus]
MKACWNWANKSSPPPALLCEEDRAGRRWELIRGQPRLGREPAGRAQNVVTTNIPAGHASSWRGNVSSLLSVKVPPVPFEPLALVCIRVSSTFSLDENRQTQVVFEQQMQLWRLVHSPAEAALQPTAAGDPTTQVWPVTSQPPRTSPAAFWTGLRRPITAPEPRARTDVGAARDTRVCARTLRTGNEPCPPERRVHLTIGFRRREPCRPVGKAPACSWPSWPMQCAHADVRQIDQGGSAALGAPVQAPILWRIQVQLRPVILKT